VEPQTQAVSGASGARVSERVNPQMEAFRHGIRLRGLGRLRAYSETLTEVRDCEETAVGPALSRRDQ
jgi:hypothetical protein